jgi:hypothetical protein
MEDQAQGADDKNAAETQMNGPYRPAASAASTLIAAILNVRIVLARSPLHISGSRIAFRKKVWKAQYQEDYSL